MFNEASHAGVFANIVSQIEEAIVDGELTPDEKLPPERDLMKIFKTSRGPVREALKALEQKKMIKIKPGSGGGAVVLPIGTTLLSETLGMLVRNRQVPPSHVAEFREELEGLAASLTADRIDQEELSEIEEQWCELRALLKKDKLEEFWERERGLHRLLARGSKNLMCEWILDTINLEIAGYGSFYPPKPAKAREALDDWKLIIEALNKRQAVRASSIIKAHVVKLSLLGEDHDA